MKLSWTYTGGLLGHYKDIPALLRSKCYNVNGGIAVAVNGHIEYVYGSARICINVQGEVTKLIVERVTL